MLYTGWLHGRSLRERWTICHLKAPASMHLDLVGWEVSGSWRAPNKMSWRVDATFHSHTKVRGIFKYQRSEHTSNQVYLLMSQT